MTFFSNYLFTKRSVKVRNDGLLTGIRFEHASGGQIGSSHKVNNLERRFLVWTGKYKKVEEVPPFVPQSTMERCRNRMRIKIANYMMLVTVIGCIGMVYLGKQDAKKGISLTQQNLDWHANMKKEHENNKQI